MIRPAAALLAVLAGGAQAQGLDLTARERAAFRAEVRAFLMDEPALLRRALEGASVASSEMSALAADDLATLQRLGPPLLDGADIALVTAADCPACDRAKAELSDLSRDYGATFTLHDRTEAAALALAQALEIDTVPFYVLPGMVVRGHVPPVVLRRYLD